MRGRIRPVIPAALAAVLLLGASVALADETYEGRIESVGDDNFVVKVGVEQYRFLVSEKTTITLDGENAKLPDLKAGHNVKVTATKEEDDKLTATKVEAKSKESLVPNRS